MISLPIFINIYRL